jgi:hypothetical protein
VHCNQLFELSSSFELTVQHRISHGPTDLVTLTQNYLKLLLHFLTDEVQDAGILVHCISGWDRTPLFVSLLRLSLWADGEIHQSLSAAEILYLTVGMYTMHEPCCLLACLLTLTALPVCLLFASVRLDAVRPSARGSPTKRRRHFLFLLLHFGIPYER